MYGYSILFQSDVAVDDSFFFQLMFFMIIYGFLMALIYLLGMFSICSFLYVGRKMFHDGNVYKEKLAHLEEVRYGHRATITLGDAQSN